MTLLFAGLIAAGLAAPNPALGQGIGIGGAVPLGRVSLPYYPIPITSIGRPTIQLPSPVVPIPSLPNPSMRPGGSVVVPLPAPVTIAVRLPAPQMPELYPTLPRPEIYPTLPRPMAVPLGPQQYPRPVSPTPDPIPTPIPLTLKGPARLMAAMAQSSSGSLENAASQLNAMFDSAEKPAPAPVETIEDKKPAAGKEQSNEVRSERRITLPEWDLENDIGLNPSEPGW